MIKVNLDRVILERNISSKELAEKIGSTPANLYILKTGKARGIRFATLDKLCQILDCQPGDILEYEKWVDTDLISTHLLLQANFISTKLLST